MSEEIRVTDATTGAQKKCSKCGKTLPVEMFYFRDAANTRRSSSCKPCARTQGKEYYMSHKRFWKHPDGTWKTTRKTHEAQKQYYAKNRGRILELMKKRKYGVDQALYDQMVLKQGGVCAVCHLPCASGRKLAIDHNHSTGVVRGLLCGRCNNALGSMREDPALIRGLARYVEQFNTGSVGI